MPRQWTASSSYLKTLDTEEQVDRLQGKAISSIDIWLILNELYHGTVYTEQSQYPLPAAAADSG